MKPGYKQTEVVVIPQEWEVKPFTQVTDLIICGIAATPNYVSKSQGYPFLSSTNVKEGESCGKATSTSVRTFTTSSSETIHSPDVARGLPR